MINELRSIRPLSSKEKGEKGKKNNHIDWSIILNKTITGNKCTDLKCILHIEKTAVWNVR